MRVVSCLDPQHIVNPYTHEHLTVACGKCRSCRNALAKRWINKLEHERRCWKYCYFVTLTYDNFNLPKLFDNGRCVLVDKDDDSVRIPFEELKFSTSKDADYFNSRIRHNLGIPYARVSDIQKFHKRLNKYIHDNITQKYKNFRYFVASELGKDTFRPHYHGLYFFNDRRVSDSFQEILAKTWSVDGRTKGRFDAQIVLGTATSYVAQYINMFANLPSIYQSGKLKPFYVFSKSPSIGSLAPLATDLSEIFFSCSPTRIQYDFKTNKYIDVRLPYSLENRLFPRIPKYSEISLSLRVSLYGLDRASGAESFSEFVSWLDKVGKSSIYPNNFLNCSEYGKNINNYLLWLTNGFKLDRFDYFTDADFSQTINRVKRFYYNVSRCSAQADVFGISLDCYVGNIDKYYKNLDNLKLRNFYEAQEHYTCARHDVEDLALMYQDSEDFIYRNGFEYVPKIKDSFAFMDLKATSDKIYNDSTKTHRKNDYLDRCRDAKLSLILKDYFA